MEPTAFGPRTRHMTGTTVPTKCSRARFLIKHCYTYILQMRRQQFLLYLKELFAIHSQYPKYLGQQNTLFHIKMENDGVAKVVFQQRG
jgi:hypothetical protein